VNYTIFSVPEPRLAPRAASWPDEVKVKWFDGFHRLMRQGLEGKQP